MNFIQLPIVTDATAVFDDAPAPPPLANVVVTSIENEPAPAVS